jgi:hypothetical protein
MVTFSAVFIAKTPSKTPYKRPRIVSARPEWGDCKGVERTFGIKETLCYDLLRKDKIKGVLIPGTGRAEASGFSISPRFGDSSRRRRGNESAARKKGPRTLKE